MECTKETFIQCGTWLLFESFIWHIAYSFQSSVLCIFPVMTPKGKVILQHSKSVIFTCVLVEVTYRMDILDKHSLPSNAELRLRLSGCKNPMP